MALDLVISDQQQKLSFSLTNARGTSYNLSAHFTPVYGRTVKIESVWSSKANFIALKYDSVTVGFCQTDDFKIFTRTHGDQRMLLFGGYLDERSNKAKGPILQSDLQIFAEREMVEEEAWP